MTSLSVAFRSPFVRIPFLAFAVISTVATSAPAWDLQANPISEDITLAPGESYVRKVEYSASQPVAFNTEIRAAQGVAQVRIENEDTSSSHHDLDDSKFAHDLDAGTLDASTNASLGGAVVKGCDGHWRATRGGVSWHFITDDGREIPAYESSEVSAGGSCDTKAGTVTLTVTNEDSAELKAHVSTTVTIRGDDSDDPPKGAFVTAKVVP
jgi:hypothetical protein